jgi:hypothetical protein
MVRKTGRGRRWGSQFLEGKREEVERCLLVYHDDGRGAQAWRWHQKNGRWRRPPRKKMAKVVSQKYAFIAGTRVLLRARAYWASWLAGSRTAAVQLGPRTRVGRWANQVKRERRARPSMPARLKWKKVWVQV